MQEDNELGVKVESRKGQYGNTSGKSANALYKNYKDYIVSKGQKPLDFVSWLKWAKEKNIVDPKMNATGEEGIGNEEIEKATDLSKKTKQIILIVVVGGIVVGLGIKAYVYYKNKNTGQ